MYKYSAQDVTVIVDGKIISDFAEGSMVTASETNSHVNPTVDSQGKGAMAINEDRRSTFTINVKKSSDANADFTKILNSAKEVAISVAHGSEKSSATSAYIEKAPDVGYDSNVPTRTWTFSALDYKYTI